VVHSENRLVDEAGDHAKGVEAGHVICGQDAMDPGLRAAPCLKIAEGKSGRGMGRADDPRDQSTGWGNVIAKRL